MKTLNETDVHLDFIFFKMDSLGKSNIWHHNIFSEMELRGVVKRNCWDPTVMVVKLTG